MSIAQNITLENAVLSTVIALAVDAYPDERARIIRGGRLYHKGHVVKATDGWVVVSEQSIATYKIKDGKCDCADSDFGAPEGRCKHRWAVCFAKRVEDAMTDSGDRYGATDLINCKDGVATAIVVKRSCGDDPTVFLFAPYDETPASIMPTCSLSIGAKL